MSFQLNSQPTVQAQYPLRRHRNALIGFAVGVLVAIVFVAIWALFHSVEVRYYPFYFLAWFGSFWPTHGHMISLDKLHYLLFRYGNEAGTLNTQLAYYRIPVRAYRPIFSTDPLGFVFVPAAALVFYPMICTFIGMVKDYSYMRMLRTDGIHLEGSRLMTPQQYNKTVKGDGMRYILDVDKK